MGKKSSRKVIKKAGPAKVPTIFDCPVCSHSQCVEVKLKRTEMKAHLWCRVCHAKHDCDIDPLMKEMQVFCEWKDLIEEREHNRILGFQDEDSEQDSADELAVGNGTQSNDDKGVPGVSSHSKGIQKKQKKR